MVTYRKRAIDMTEQRASVMGEILRCIRLIKMTAIENSFLDKIQGRRGKHLCAHRVSVALREKEKHHIRVAGYAQSLAIATGTCVPVIATIVTFSAHIGSGNELNASQVYGCKGACVHVSTGVLRDHRLLCDDVWHTHDTVRNAFYRRGVRIVAQHTGTQ